MVENVAVVMEQKTQDTTRRNKVEQGTGRLIDRNAQFTLRVFVQVKLSGGLKA